ncbi:MAG TPA: hypothetical protein VIU85_07680, partial [Chthoniobacterales bacterium]
MAKRAFASKSKWPAFPLSGPQRSTQLLNNSTFQHLVSTKTAIDPKVVKQLREKTNAGMMDC